MNSQDPDRRPPGDATDPARSRALFEHAVERLDASAGNQLRLMRRDALASASTVRIGKLAWTGAAAMAAVLLGLAWWLPRDNRTSARGGSAWSPSRRMPFYPWRMTPSFMRGWAMLRSPSIPLVVRCEAQLRIGQLAARDRLHDVAHGCGRDDSTRGDRASLERTQRPAAGGAGRVRRSMGPHGCVPSGKDPGTLRALERHAASRARGAARRSAQFPRDVARAAGKNAPEHECGARATRRAAASVATPVAVTDAAAETGVARARRARHQRAALARFRGARLPVNRRAAAQLRFSPPWVRQVFAINSSSQSSLN